MATKKKNPKLKRDMYAEITDRVISAMQKDGVAPWQKPWKSDARGSLLPRNAVSGRPYRGINVILTWMTASSRDYALPIWLTFKQANEIAAKAHKAAGRKVQKNDRGSWVFADGEDKGKSCGGIKAGQNQKSGAGATTVVFWKPMVSEETDDAGNTKKKSWMMMRTYSVFNIEQCDDHVIQYVTNQETEAIKAEIQMAPIDAAEAICNQFDVPTVHQGDRAFYSSVMDKITLPKRSAFRTLEDYYSARFHEMGHATGHESRLDRKSLKTIGNIHIYSEEELVAEFTACFLAAEAGIERKVEENSVAYLKLWAQKLKEDPKLIIHAAQRAQKAADFILGRLEPAKDADESEAA